MDVLMGLKELDEPGKPPILKSLVDMFTTSFPKYMDDMKKALDAGDFITIQRRAHTLKSSCGNLGAVELSELCRILEQNKNWNPPDEVRKLLKKMDEEYVKVRAILLELI